MTPDLVWDGRFAVEETGNMACRIGVLGAEGVALLKKNPAAWQALETLPHKVRLTLPGLYLENALAAVPHVGFFSVPELEKTRIVSRLRQV